MSVGIVVLTLNPGQQWLKWIEAVKQQRINIAKTLVIDSGSNDNTIELSKSAGFDIISINKQEFNHGKTVS